MGKSKKDEIKQETTHNAVVGKMGVGVVNEMFSKNPMLAKVDFSKVNPDNF